MHPGRLVLCVGLIVCLTATTAAPASADMPTPYSAQFPQERTVQTPTCPPGAPQGSFCFTGSDHSGQGTSTPPEAPKPATEDFTGYVDMTQTTTCSDGSTGYRDHNTVTIGTNTGQLFLTTDGVDCPSAGTAGTDDGVWHAVGGTGQFKNASGSGTVHTQAKGGSPKNPPILSDSAYSGTLVLQ